MKITDSQYKDIIAKYFDYSLNFDFLDIVADAINSINDIEVLDADNIYDEVLNAVDYATTYTKDRWTIAQYYFSSPEDLTEVEDVYEDFTEDIFKIVLAIQEDNRK